MFIKDGIAYASNNYKEDIKIAGVKVVGELSLLIFFSTGEERIFDMQYLSEYPVYQKLKNKDYFKTVKVENGILIWGEGELDISSEEVYNNSFEYEKQIAQ